MARWKVTFQEVSEIQIVVEMPDEFTAFDAECVAESYLCGGDWPHSDEMPEHEIIGEYPGMTYLMDDADVEKVL